MEHYFSNLNELQENIWINKYKYENETIDEWIDRISNNNLKLKKLILDKKFLFGGRILANRGLQNKGRKITYSNCYVLGQPQDNLESIFDTAKDMARTFSYGGGVGIDISKLRPKGSEVNNAAATTTGAVSFMDLYNITTDIIGQRGRRGALMISMDIDHPDIEEFVDIKNNTDKITKANISVKMNDKFMERVLKDEYYNCIMFVDDTLETIIKPIKAKELFLKIIKNNWNYAEPGMLFWDTIKNNHFLTHDNEFEYAGVNPCAK